MRHRASPRLYQVGSRTGAPVWLMPCHVSSPLHVGRVESWRAGLANTFRPRHVSSSLHVGRVEDWRAGFGRDASRPSHVSSPRHIERNMRISRIALSHLLHVEVYGTYPAGATFGSAYSIVPSRGPVAPEHTNVLTRNAGAVRPSP